MNVTISNGYANVAIIRKANTLEKVAQIRPLETRSISLADGSYEVSFIGAGGGSILTPPENMPFTVGTGGVDQLYIYSTGTGTSFDARLANSYTLVGYTLPAYVQDNDSFAFFAGFTLACTVRIFRVARRWFARVAEDTNT